jgi:divinyl protochlorophyllide a 8-vinyl-reductase
MNAGLALTAGRVGRIGPNAITRVAEVLPGFVGDAETRAVFEHARLADYLRSPPQDMVDEAEVTRLHLALRKALGGRLAGQVARSAGQRTADYLLAHRIPRPVQALLKRLPAPWAARLLLSAIRRHAWTFAGSGQFSADAGSGVLAGRPGRPVVLTIRNNPLCKGLTSDAPACDFYAATFERLFRTLVHRDARAFEVACEARGDAECRFELRW